MTRQTYSCQGRGEDSDHAGKEGFYKINNVHVYYNCYVKYFDLYVLYFVKYRQRMSVR